jgi:hypothetical protein
MSISTSDKEYRARIEIAHDTIRRAIQQYKDILITYGTCPSFEIADELSKYCDEILGHDFDGGERPIIALIDYATQEESEQPKDNEESD